VSGRDDEPTTSPEHALPALPPTVAATHLAASAAELTGAGVADLAELTDVLNQLVAGQRDIAATLTRLADHITDRHACGALAAASAPDVAALTEVLAAAAAATGHAAGALAQTGPVLDIVVTAAGPDATI
jgi:hypothetical protein